MRHWLKKSVRLLLTLTVLAVSISVLQMVVLPRFVRKLILSRLAEIGLSEASLDVRSCSLRSAELTDVELGKERCACIGALTAEYSLGSLLRGKVKRVLITGGQLALRIRDGRIEFGELAQITAKGGRRAGEAPFDSIELRACTLTVDWGQKQICIPCDGAIRNNSTGWTIHDLRLNFQGTPLQLKATLYAGAETLAFSLDKQDLDLRALISALPLEGLPIPARLAGGIGLKLQGEISRDGSDALLRASLSNAWIKTSVAGFPIDAEGLDGEFEVELESLSQLKNVVARLSSETLELAGITASNVHLNVKKISEQLVFSGEAQAEQWRLNRFTATLPTARHPENPQMDRAEAAWELEGNLPELIADRLAANAVDISGLGRMSLSGALSTTLSRAPDVDLTSLQVALSPGTLRLDRGRSSLEGLSGTLKFRGSCNQKEARLQLLSGSTLNFNSARLESIAFGKTGLALETAEGRDAARCTFNEDGVATRVSLEANTDDTNIRVGDNALMTQLDSIHLSLGATFSPEHDQASATLTADAVRLYPDYRGLFLDLQNVGLRVDSNLGGDEEAVVNATLTLEEATLLNGKSEALFALDQEALKPISGSFNLKQRRGMARWQWPLQKDTTLYANAHIDLREKRPSGFISVSCEGFNIEEEEAAVRMLANSTGLTVSGDFSLKGDLRLEQGHFVPRVTIAATDTTLSSKRYKAQAEGINGAITFTDFSPISTPGNQRFEVQSFRLGKLNLQDGFIALCFEDDPPAILIERAEWGCLGGRVYSRALRIDPNQSKIDIRFFANGLDMDKLFGLAFGEGGTGKGTLYGMIPASVSRSNLADFTIGEGFLHATTGEGSWTLADSNSANIVQKVLEQQLGQMLQESVEVSIQDKIFRGLRDFEYSMFKIDFVRREDGILARVTTRGRSRDPRIPVEFEEIVLDFPGFDENLRKIMVIKTAIGQGLKQTMDNLER